MCRCPFFGGWGISSIVFVFRACSCSGRCPKSSALACHLHTYTSTIPNSPISPPADQSSACLHLVEISVCTEMNTICLTSRCWKYTALHGRVGCRLYICRSQVPIPPPPILSPICSALPCHTRRMGNVFQIVAVSLRDIWSELLCFVSVSMLAAVSDGCCVLPFYKHHGHFVIWVVQFV